MPKSVVTQNGLNSMQERFCYEYVANGFRVTQAAIDAGYSEKTADSQGSQLLRKTKVQERVNELKDRLLTKLTAKAEKILGELAIIGFSDITEFFQQGTHTMELVDFKKLGSVRRAIKSIEVIPQGYEGTGEDRRRLPDKVKFSLWSKEKALELLGTNQDMFVKKMKFGDDGDVVPVMLMLPDNRRDSEHPGRKRKD
jgi:phage terminase small subunit